MSYASQEQAQRCVALFDKIIARTAKLVSVMPKQAYLPTKSREFKSGATEKTKLLQRSPEAREIRDAAIIAAFEKVGSVVEAARIADTSSTTASRVLALVGLTTPRKKLPPKAKGSVLYKTIIKEISISKTK